MGRFARNLIARASGGSVALSRLWPGRTDRLIIAPHDLRTADATRAAEIYAGRFVFAGKIVTCHGRSIFDLEPPSEDWEVALLGFGWLRHLRAATRKLSDELQRQILPDGGHISRNPGALIELLIDLLPLRQTFAARNSAPPSALLNAIDPMMPMLRFFRHGDGSFAMFNGMSSAPSDLLATLLAYDDTHGAPMANMPHTGFQRLDARAMTVIMDTGPPPAASVSRDAHAGCLPVELSSGPSRIVINCGMPTTGRDNWRSFARGTAAHSTLTCHDTSSCQFVELSAMKRFLQGAPVVSGPANVESYREVVANGVLLTTSHDGYLSRFGVLHRRLLMVAHDGSRLDGEDTVSPAPGARIKGDETDFALRFHLHPAVKASRLSDGRGVMLVLPNRDVWTFEALDDNVGLEDSVFPAGTKAGIPSHRGSPRQAFWRWRGNLDADAGRLRYLACGANRRCQPHSDHQDQGRLRRKLRRYRSE